MPSCSTKMFLWRKSCGWDALKTCLPSLPFPVLGLPDFKYIAWPLHNCTEIPSNVVWKPDRPNVIYIHRQRGRHLVVHSSVIIFPTSWYLNPLKPELNPIFYLLALLGTHHFLHVSRIRVKLLTFRLLMPYIYIWSTHS